MEHRIKRKSKKDPEGRLLMLFEVVDVIDGKEHPSADRPYLNRKKRRRNG